MTVALQMCVHYFKEHGEGSVNNRLGWFETFEIWGCLRVILLFFGGGENILVMETFGLENL